MAVPVIFISTESIEYVTVPERAHFFIRLRGSGDHYLLARLRAVIIVVRSGGVVRVGTPEIIFSRKYEMLRNSEVYAVSHIKIADTLGEMIFPGKNLRRIASHKVCLGAHDFGRIYDQRAVRIDRRERRRTYEPHSLEKQISILVSTPFVIADIVGNVVGIFYPLRHIGGYLGPHGIILIGT